RVHRGLREDGKEVHRSLGARDGQGLVDVGAALTTHVGRPTAHMRSTSATAEACVFVTGSLSASHAASLATSHAAAPATALAASLATSHAAAPATAPAASLAAALAASLAAAPATS